MKALIAALALVTLLASPTFAQTAPTANSPTCGGYGWGPSSPCYGEYRRLGEDFRYTPTRWLDCAAGPVPAA